jgi:hypothetical protein
MGSSSKINNKKEIAWAEIDLKKNRQRTLKAGSVEHVARDAHGLVRGVNGLVALAARAVRGFHGLCFCHPSNNGRLKKNPNFIDYNINALINPILL